MVSFNKNIQNVGPILNFFSDCHILKFLEIKKASSKCRKIMSKVKENVTYLTSVKFWNNKVMTHMSISEDLMSISEDLSPRSMYRSPGLFVNLRAISVSATPGA